MTDLIDTRLGLYHLTEVIGRGGMSNVYKAYQPSLERFVAVKVLQHNSDPLFAARFKREALAIAQMQHPNILPIYDFGEQHGRLYLVMQYVENSATLADLLGRPMALLPALRLTCHVLAALDYAHARGVVHRDIKPGNILMASPTWPMLADFGIAKLMSDSMRLTMSGTIIGTAAYMAPEQASGEEIDARADLYSAGIVLYELLTGRVPFDADTPIAMLLKHTHTPPPPPRELNPDIPIEVEAVLLQALEKHPDERYQSATEMAEALDQLAAQSEHKVTIGRHATYQRYQARTLGATAALPASPAAPAEQRAELYQRALHEFRAGRWNAALEHLDQLLALDPADVDARKLVEQVRAAQEYAQREEQRRIARATTEARDVPRPSAAETTTCPRCGKETHPEWTVCPFCQARLRAKARPIEAQPRHTLAQRAAAVLPPHYRAWWAGALALLALGLLSGGAWAIFGSGEAQTAQSPTSAITTDSKAGPATLPPPVPTAAPATLASISLPTIPPPESPTADPQPSPTSEPTLTPSPLPAAIVSASSVNLRAGPDTLFQSLGQYDQNTALNVIGRTSDGQWLQVQTPDDRVGWMRQDNLQLNIVLDAVPVASAPPLPTKPPLPTPKPRLAPNPTAAPPTAIPVVQPTATPLPPPPTPTPTKKPKKPRGGNDGGVVQEP